MGKQPIPLAHLRALDARQRKAVMRKVAEVSQWIDAEGIADDTFLALLVAERESRHTEGG